MMTRSLEDIIEYEQVALKHIRFDHPHYDEIKQLLVEQVNDEIQDYADTRSD